jgi:hypothetical protein
VCASGALDLGFFPRDYRTVLGIIGGRESGAGIVEVRRLGAEDLAPIRLGPGLGA